MALFDDLTEPTELEALVGFFDLAHFMRIATKLNPMDQLKLMADYFSLVGGIVEDAGGWMVKTIGDAGLVVFPAEETETGVLAFLRLQRDGDAWLAERGIRSRAVVKLHVGPIAVGSVWDRQDIYGKAVATAAVMASDGFAMSPQVFRKLSTDTRKLFKKHTPPVTYIPAEAARRKSGKEGWNSMM